MDMSQSIEPNSQQVNAEDFLSGERTVTITGVEAGNSEQPVFVHLDEFPGRTYRPSKTMRRVMVSAWGKEAAEYVGRRMTLYRDPEVTFGRDKVGGIKIAALSHIDKPLSISLTVTRGRRAPHVVKPLEVAAAPAPDPVAAAKSALWAAWTDGHDADPAALGAAFSAETGVQLADATADQLTGFAATLQAGA